LVPWTLKLNVTPLNVSPFAGTLASSLKVMTVLDCAQTVVAADITPRNVSRVFIS
jgi:hypothetical protein